MNGLRLGAAFALAAAIAIGAGAGAPPGSAPRVLAAGNASHLWIVARNEGRVKLFHAADTMEPGTMREAAILAEGMPIDIAASGTRVDLLFPARSAILPRAHILSTSTRQHPASGRWLSVPADRLELMPALPEEKEIESFASSESGPMLLHAGSARLWRLERGEWQAIDLPRAVAEAPARRIERRSKSTSVLARSGPDGGWERWTHDDDGWRRVGLRVPGDADLHPIGGSNDAAVADAPGWRRLLYLPHDGPITLAEIEGGAAVAWFRTGPKLIDEQSGLRVRAIDPVSGEVGDPEAIEPARTSLVEWIHLPILGATVVAILMIVFFVRSLRQEPVTKLPTGWEPAPLSRRLVALAIDLAPIAVAVKIATGSSWSRLLVPPALVIDTEAAVPAFALIFLTVAVTGVSEAIFARSFGKLVVGVRVIDARTQEGARPSIVQTLGRNVFKAVILQLPVLGIFTLLDPLRQGIGESVSSTAVVRRIARVHTAPIG